MGTSPSQVVDKRTLAPLESNMYQGEAESTDLRSDTPVSRLSLSPSLSLSLSISLSLSSSPSLSLSCLSLKSRHVYFSRH